jgi:hypothetical protein
VSRCCEPGCAVDAAFHVQGYHDDLPWYDDYTEMCAQHVADGLLFCNALSPAGRRPTKPATAITMEEQRRRYAQWKRDQNAIADVIMAGPPSLAEAMLADLRRKPW